ncbi:glutaredoxin family protein [Mycobacterium sp. M1]|uniref:Glutaredoxin family protein n=1 Tax=Mycolicibacter acidiphilus TaxID=2835306 RepID=A0ABS5RDN8_9MYCO|nr:glutaredoxin family protein [Mycolicibacter acidiphilus]MBS9532398.1 glutaredoxin family protein [Mycolicibacter acidiphilus]
MVSIDHGLPEVIVLTKPHCQPCRATTRALAQAGIPFDVIDLTADDDGRQMVLDLGYSSAPVVVAGEEHWSGHRPDRISELARGRRGAA